MDYLINFETRLKSLFWVSTPKVSPSEESNNTYIMFYISSGAILVLLLIYKPILKAVHRGIHTFLHFFEPKVQVNQFRPAQRNSCIPMVKNDLQNISPSTLRKDRSDRECTSSLSLNSTCIWDNTFKLPESNHSMTSPVQTCFSSIKTGYKQATLTQKARDKTMKPYVLVGKELCIPDKKESPLKTCWPVGKADNETFKMQPTDVLHSNKSEAKEKCWLKKKIRSSWTLCCKENKNKRDKLLQTDCTGKQEQERDKLLQTDCTGKQEQALLFLEKKIIPIETIFKHLATQKSMHEQRCVKNVNTCKMCMYGTQEEEEDLSYSFTDNICFHWPDFRKKILVCRTSPPKTENIESKSTSTYIKDTQTYLLQKTTEAYTNNSMTDDSNQEIYTQDAKLLTMLSNMKTIYKEKNSLDCNRYEEAKFRLLKYFNHQNLFLCKRQNITRKIDDFVRHEQVHMVESLFSLKEPSQATGDTQFHNHTVNEFRFESSSLDELDSKEDNELEKERNQQDYNARFFNGNKEPRSSSVRCLENFAHSDYDISQLSGTRDTSDRRHNGDDMRSDLESDSIEIVADIISFNQDDQYQGNDILFKVRKESVPASFVTLSSFLKAKETTQQAKEAKTISEIKPTDDLLAQNEHEKPLSDHNIFANVKPLNRQVTPLSGHVKPLAQEVKPLDDPVLHVVNDVKPRADKVKTLDDPVLHVVNDVKPRADNVKPLDFYVKTLDKNVKPRIKKVATETKKTFRDKETKKTFRDKETKKSLADKETKKSLGDKEIKTPLGCVKRQGTTKEMSKVSPLARPMALLELLLGCEKQAVSMSSQEKKQNLVMKKNANSLLTQQPQDKIQRDKGAKLNSKSSFSSKFGVKNWKPGVLRNMKRKLNNKCRLRITKKTELNPNMVSCMNEICGPSNSTNSLENGAEHKNNKMSVSVDFVTFQSSGSSVFKDMTNLKELKTSSKHCSMNSPQETKIGFKSPVKEKTLLISAQRLNNVTQSSQQQNSKSPHEIRNVESLLRTNAIPTSPPPGKVVATVISTNKMNTNSEWQHEMTKNDTKSSHSLGTVSTSPHSINTISTSQHNFHNLPEVQQEINIDSRRPQGKKSMPKSPPKAQKGINDTIKQSSPTIDKDTGSYGMITIHVSKHSIHTVTQVLHIDTNYTSPIELPNINKSSHRLNIMYESPNRIVTLPQSPHRITTIPQPPHRMTTSPLSPHRMTTTTQSPQRKTTTPQCQHRITTAPQSPHRMTTTPQSPHRMTTTPQSSHRMTTTPQSPHRMTTTPQSPHRMTTSPQSPQRMTTTPQSSHRMTTTPQSSHRMITTPQSSHRMTATPQSPLRITNFPLSTHGITTIPETPYIMTTVSQSPHTVTTLPQSTHIIFTTPQSPPGFEAVPQYQCDMITIQKSPLVVSIGLSKSIVSTPESNQRMPNSPQNIHHGKEIQQSIHGINISQSPCILGNNAQRTEHSKPRTLNISGASQQVEKALSLTGEKSSASRGKANTVSSSANKIEETILNGVLESSKVCIGKCTNNVDRLSKFNTKKSGLKHSKTRSTQNSNTTNANKYNHTIKSFKQREPNTLGGKGNKECLAMFSPKKVISHEIKEKKDKLCTQKTNISRRRLPKPKLALPNKSKEDKLEGIKKKTVERKISFIAPNDSRDITTGKTFGMKDRKRKVIIPKSVSLIETIKFDVLKQEDKLIKYSSDHCKKLLKSSCDASKKLPTSSSVISKKFYMPITQRPGKSSKIPTFKQNTGLQSIKMVGLLPLSAHSKNQQKTIRKIKSCFHLEPDIENSLNREKGNCLGNNGKNMKKTPFQRKLQFLLKNNKYVCKKNLQAKNVAALIKRSSDVINNTNTIVKLKKMEVPHTKMSDKKDDIAGASKRGKKLNKFCKGHQKKFDRDSSPESVKPVSVTNNLPNILIPTISLLYKKNSLKYKSKSLCTNMTAALLNDEAEKVTNSMKSDKLTKFYSDHQVIKVIRSQSMNYFKYNKASDICTLQPPTIQLKGRSGLDLLPTIDTFEVYDAEGSLDNDNSIKGDMKKCCSDISLAHESLDVKRIPSAKSVVSHSRSLKSGSPKHVNNENKAKEYIKAKENTYHRQTVGQKDVNSDYTNVSCADNDANLAQINNVILSVCDNSIRHDNKNRPFFPFNHKTLIKQDTMNFMSAHVIKGPSVKTSDSSEASLISSQYDVSKTEVGFRSVQSDHDLQFSKAPPVRNKQRTLSSADLMLNPQTDSPKPSLHECVYNKQSPPKGLITLSLNDFNPNLKMPTKNSKLNNKTAKVYHPSFSSNDLFEDQKSSSNKWHFLPETKKSMLSSCFPMSETKMKIDLSDIQVNKQDLDLAAMSKSSCQFSKQLLGLEEKFDKSLISGRDTSVDLHLEKALKIKSLEKENKDISEEKNGLAWKTNGNGELYGSLEEKDSTTLSIPTELEAISYHFGDDVTLKSCSNLEVSRSLSLVERNSAKKQATEHKRKKTMKDASPLVEFKKRRLSVLNSKRKKKLKCYVSLMNRKLFRKCDVKYLTACNHLSNPLAINQTKIVEHDNHCMTNTLESKKENYLATHQTKIDEYENHIMTNTLKSKEERLQHDISKSEKSFQVSENIKRSDLFGNVPISEDLESILNLELTGFDEGVDSNLYSDTKLLFSKHNRSVKKVDRSRRRSSLIMGRVPMNFPMSRENGMQDRENKKTESNNSLHSIHPPKPGGKKYKKLTEFLLSKRQCEMSPIYIGQMARSKGSTVTSTTQSSEEEERLLAVLEQPFKIHSSWSRGKTFEPADCPPPRTLKSTGARSGSVELIPTKKWWECLKENSIKESYCNENLCSDDIITPYTDMEEVDLPSEHYIHCVVPQDTQLDRNMCKEYLSLPTHKSADCSKKKEEDNEFAVQISTNISKSSLPPGLESQVNSFSNQSKNHEVHISDMFLTQSTIDKIHDENDHMTVDNKSSSSSSIVLSWIGSDVSEVDNVLDPNTHRFKSYKTVHGQDVNLFAVKSGNVYNDFFHAQHRPISPFKFDPIETLNNSMEIYCSREHGYLGEHSAQFKHNTSFKIASDNQSLLSHSNYLAFTKTSQQKDLSNQAKVFHSNQVQSTSDFPFTNESGQDFTSCSETMSGSHSFGDAGKKANNIHYTGHLFTKTKQESTGLIHKIIANKTDFKKKSKLKMKVGPFDSKQQTLTSLRPQTIKRTEPCTLPSTNFKSMTPENKLLSNWHKKTLPSTEHLASSSSYNSCVSRQSKLKSSKNQHSNKSAYHKPARENATSNWYKPQYVPPSPSLTENHSWPLNLKGGSSKINKPHVQEALSEPLNCTRDKWPNSETNSDVDTFDALSAETRAHNQSTDHKEDPEGQNTPAEPQKVKNIIQMFEQRKKL